MKSLLKITILVTLLFFQVGFSQVTTWQEKAEKLSNDTFEKAIQPSKFRITSNPSLSLIQNWKSDPAISGENVYTKIIGWNDFLEPKKTGIIVKHQVKLDTTLFPYYTYIPENYSNKKPTKLLIYYRGGWISRDTFPENIDKEIVSENPTFKYLDHYNIIEIFPAVKSDLAIYGRYGYEHLRKMVLQTKQLFNIDDNQVYLAGFSDGGRTVLNIAYLAPTNYAAFFTINGTINSSKANFPNFSNRKIVSFMAEDDGLVPYQYPSSMAQKANEWNADWTLHLLKGKQHFYYPYEAEVLPLLFQHIENTHRNPYPNAILYHKSYDYKEFTNIDWLQITTDSKKEPEDWHHTSMTTIMRSKDEIDTFNYGEKTAQVEATYFNNTFTVKASLVNDIDIYISPLMVNVKIPVIVIVNGKEVFNEMIDYNKDFIIEQFENNFDRKQVWINKVHLKVE